MDGYHPKRRKDKHNPYNITEKDGRYYLASCDGQGEAHHMEIEKPLYDTLNNFELEDISPMNVVDRHIEQSELTEMSLHRRTVTNIISFVPIFVSVIFVVCYVSLFLTDGGLMFSP